MESIAAPDGTSFAYRLIWSELKYMERDKYVSLAGFACGETVWGLRCYPKGNAMALDGFASVFLQCLCSPKPVEVQFSLQLYKYGERRSSNSSRGMFTKGVLKGFSDFIGVQELQQLCTSNGDCVLSCAITQPHKVPCNCPLSADIRKWFNNEERSDVKFLVDGRTVHAHRFVLAARSPVFKEIVYGDNFAQPQPIITITGIEPDVFESVLNFFYTDNIPLGKSMIFLQKLICAGELYQVPTLVQKCEEALTMELTVETVVEVLIAADTHNQTNIKAICLRFLARERVLKEAILTPGFSEIGARKWHLLDELRAVLR